MRSNKLRLAALAMSFVMAATAVPSVAFAEDLFTSDEAVSEEVAFDDGAEFVEEPVVDFVEPEAVEEDYVTAAVSDGVEAGAWFLRDADVYFAYDEEGKDDYTVWYNPSSSDDKDTHMFEEMKQLLDKDGKAVTATKVEGSEKNPTCTEKGQFDLQVTINYEELDESGITYDGNKDVKSRVYTTKKPIEVDATGHNWKDQPIVSYSVPPTCTVDGYTVPDQKCSVCGASRYENDAKYAEGLTPTPIPAKGHQGLGNITEGYNVSDTEIDSFEDTDDSTTPITVYAANSTLVDGKPDFVNDTQDCTYSIVKIDTCKVCGEKFVTETVKTVTILAKGHGTPYIGNVVNISNIKDDITDTTDPDYMYDATSSNYLKIEEEDIEFTNCYKEGKYSVLVDRQDPEDPNKTITDVVDTVTVPAPHHTLDKIEIRKTDDTVLATVTVGKDATTGKKTYTVTKEGQDAAQEVGLSVVCKDDTLIITNLSCKDPYTYKLVEICKNDLKKDGKTKGEKHEISSKTITADPEGPHLINEEKYQKVVGIDAAGAVDYKTLEKLVGDYNPDKAPQTGDDLNVSIRIGTANCENAGTVFVDFSCYVCNKVIKTDEVNVKAIGHIAGTATVEGYKAPTCTEVGGYDVVTKCTICGEVLSSRHVEIEALDHQYGKKYEVLGYVGKLIVGGGYKVTDPVPNDGILGEDRKVAVVAAKVCERCQKSAIENAEPVYKDGTVDETYYKPADGTIVKIEPGLHYCEERKLTVDAKYEKLTDTFEFPYYETALDFSGRTPHDTVVVPENRVEPTETTKGSYDAVTKCKLCDLVIDKETVILPELDHVHDWKKEPAKEATCTEEGNKEYYFCEACESYSLDGVTECTKAETVIPAEHKYTEVEEVPATCTEAGVKAHYECSVCGEKFEEDEVAEEFVKVESEDDLVIEALGHDLEKVEAKAPTASEEGNIEYYVCTRCGKLFSDAEGTTETTEEEVKLPKLELPAKVTGVKTNAYPSDVYPSKGFMKVTWTAVEGADDYRVSYRALGETTWTKVLTGGANSITLDETALTVGTSYEIRVAAGKEGVFGPRSDVLRRYYESVTPTYTRTSDSISVTWPAVEKGSSYMVIYSENKSMKPYKTIIVRNGILTATLKNLKAGTKYYVRVRPYDKTGKTATGALSPLKCVTTKK